MIADNIATQTQGPKPAPSPSSSTANGASQRSFADLLATIPSPTQASDKADEVEARAKSFRRKSQDTTDDSNAGAAAVSGTSPQVQPTTPAQASAQAGSTAANGANATPGQDPTQDAKAALAALAAGAKDAASANAPAVPQGAAATAAANAATATPRATGSGTPPGAGDIGAKVAAGAKKLVSQSSVALASVSPTDVATARADMTKDLHGAATKGTANTAAQTPDATNTQQAPAPQAAPDAKPQPSPATLATENAAAQAAVAHAAKAEAGTGESTTVATDSVKTDDAATPTGLPLANGMSNLPQAQETAQADAPQRPNTPPPPVLEQVAINLKQAIGSGFDQIEIQLHPATLGAIQVKLDLSHDGKVTATVTADRNETLQLLQKDAGGLQQALRDAGLQADSNSLNFSLRGDGNASQQQFGQAMGNGGRGQNGGPAVPQAQRIDDIGPVVAAATTRSGQNGRLDIQV